VATIQTRESMLVTQAIVLLVLLLNPSRAWSQIDANKGSISGTVVDPAKAPIPQARVIALRSGTGLQRETQTNDDGQYRLTSLDPGVYEVRVEAIDFAASVREVVVNVGGSVQVNFTVALEATTETVDLSTSLISVTESSTSQVLTQEAIQNLPIDGRRFQDFATLTPTAKAIAETRGQLSFIGQRGINSNVMVDGADYNEPFLGGIRGGDRSIFAFTIPQSAIQEFQAVTSGYSAEYGRSTGGILNAVTRSGSNALHGESFYQIRHKELGKLNPLGQQSLETQHQFGAGVGGPIRTDRLFFFAAIERQLATFPRFVQFSALDTVGDVTADIAPAYNHFRSLETPFDQTNNILALLGRLDYQFSGGSRLTGRYHYSRNVARHAISSGTSLDPQTNRALSNNGDERDRIHTAVGQWTGILGPSVLNDLRIQFSHEERPRTANATSPTVDANVIGIFGTQSFLPSQASNYRFQVADGMTLQPGSHTVKVGIDYSYLGAKQSSGLNQFGAFIISDSNVRNILRILSASGGPQGNRFDDPSVVYRRQVGNLAFQTNAHQLALFVQDSWRVNPSFTLNYGLRWEGQFNPSPRTDNDFLVNSVNFSATPADLFKSRLVDPRPSTSSSWQEDST